MTPVTGARRYRLDGSVQRFGSVVVGGSPLGLFRLTDAGARLVRRIADGEPVPPSVLVDRLVDAGAIHPLPDAGPYTDADVTVVVPCRRAPAAPVPRLPGGAIVVDDASPVPVPGAAVRFEVNRGPGAARNAGLARVTTPLVAFVDDDVELPARWLDALLPHFADDRVALVAPRVRSTPSAGRLAAYEEARSPLDLGPEPGRIRRGTRVGYVPAAAVVCRTDAVRALGGFDETLRFGEDVDLVWRLDDAGHRCRYEPSSVVHHAPRAGWCGWFRQRVGYGSSAGPLARRHPGALAPIRMSGWSVAAWVLAAVGRPVLGSAVGAGSAAALVVKLPDVPPRAAFRLAGLGNLRAGEQIADAIRRVWWPLLAVASIRSRHARRVLLAAALGARGPVRLADDVAYSLGVWRGMVAARTCGPLVPEISAWPGRAARRTAGPPAPGAAAR